MSFVNYAEPIRQTYKSAVGAWGATTATESYIGPPGRHGLVRDIEVFLTASAVGTAAVPEVDVGTASGDTTYAQFRVGSSATAGLVATATPVRAASLLDSYNEVGADTLPGKQATDFTNHVALEKAFVPADTAFVITNKQGSGGTPAGTGYSVVTIDWF